MKLLVACFLAAALPLAAHVGSPDVFYEGNAGPYKLLVTIRPPQVVPGVAEIEIRSVDPGVRQIHIVPLRLGVTGQFTPVADLARPSKEDPQFFTGSLWLMGAGSWQVRVNVDGDRGPATLSVPVPALAARVLGMERATSLVLLSLCLVLCIGIVSIAGASVREAPLAAGEEPDAAHIHGSRKVMAVTALVMAGLLWLGHEWWSSEDSDYREYVYKPLQLKTSIENGGRLVLHLYDPGWLNRRTDDLLPDHGHLMHLYVIGQPDMNLVWHLHPERNQNEDFVQQLPAMPAGRYALFGDVVHANGLPETAAAQIVLPAIAGEPLTGDDAGGVPVSDGYRIVWDRAAGPLHARQPYLFQFHLEDARGQPAKDMELYMGMQGHAAFVRTDLSVFAHVHPSGTVPMPALMLGQMGQPMTHEMPMEMSGSVPAAVSFPYGFPKPGAYRIYVQMKHGGKVETGIFDAKVDN